MTIKWHRSMTFVAGFMLSVLSSTTLWAQTPSSSTGSPAQVPNLISGQQVLHPNDQLVVTAKDVEGLTNRILPVEADGTVMVPLVGKVRAEGLTIGEFEKALATQLMVYVRSPEVSARRLESEVDTIVVSGAFKSPGVYPLSERRQVLDVLSAVGGLEPNASRVIKIRRRLDSNHHPLPSSVQDRAAGVSIGTVNLARMMQTPGAIDMVLIEPGDVLFAEPAVIYLTGEVQKPGSYELSSRDSLTITELISEGGGLARGAAPEKTKILRPILNGAKRAEIAVNAKRILNGQATDFRVLPNDVVVVPRAGSALKTIGRASMFVVPALLSSVIFLAIR